MAWFDKSYRRVQVSSLEQLERGTDVTLETANGVQHIGKIDELIEADATYAVFIDDRDLVRYVCLDTHQWCDREAFSQEWNRVVFLTFMTNQLHVTHTAKQLDAVREVLGHATGSGIAGHIDAMRTSLDRVQTTLEGKVARNARVVYVRSAIIAAMAVIVPSLIALAVIAELERVDGVDPLVEWGYVLVLGMLGGSTGGLFSILTSAKREVPFDPLSSARYAAFEARTRVLLGVVSGLLMALCYWEEIISSSLAQLSSKTAGAFFFAVVAGFAERLMPQLLSMTEKQIQSEQGAGGAANGGPAEADPAEAKPAPEPESAGLADERANPSAPA